MKALGASSLIAILLLSPPFEAEAQQEDQQAAETGTTQEGRKSPFLAGVLEWVIPTAGHAYGGNWGRGVPPNLLRVGGAVFVLATLEEVEKAGFLSSYTTRECTGVCNIGIAAALAGGVWAVWSAIETAKEFNNSLPRASPSPTLSPSPEGGLLFGFQIRF